MDLYLKITHERQKIAAPVDSLGCHIVLEKENNATRKFQILVALMLSSQTKDEVTNQALHNIYNALGEITPHAILSADDNILHSCIRMVGFHNKKLKYLKEASSIVLKSGMPSTVNELMSLPGVGSKMAYLYFQHACGQIYGIGVDTHVHRVSNRIGLVSTKTPEQTRKALEAVVPKSEWKKINSVLVGYGQTVCLPIRPKCHACAINKECPNSKVVSW
ncbi:endonuclease III [Enteropsectra breve]|nr:endonuclease III [Enteropsectra breve]